MRDSARTVWISPPERRGAHSTPDYGLRKKRQTAGRKAELTRSACYDWVTELPVTKRDRLTWSWRAGLLRSRAWSLVKPAGRGGQEGGTPRLPVGCLRRGARGDGRGDAQGGARSTETAPSFASPPPSRCTAACLLGPGRGQSPAVCWVGLESGRLQPLPPIARPTVFHSPCGPLGGNLAQALLFSRTAYGCSPQCLLPASSLEVQGWEKPRGWWFSRDLGLPIEQSSPFPA
ncbi:uncharacterized protein [Bos taurus]|uniref:uncharacterized protein isoform X5 n=1 Tax=Bos taurus TaxID=9913 RepID=UPI000D53604F|nr:uncharacterized protein LOC101904339 isoform X5 [Bos taurus]